MVVLVVVVGLENVDLVVVGEASKQHSVVTCTKPMRTDESRAS